VTITLSASYRRCMNRKFVVALVALVLMGSIYASGQLALAGFSAKRASVSGLAIPKGTNGIAAIVYGRLSVTTKSGLHLRGLPVSAAALSPGALNVAAGVGRSLVLLAPSGKRLWTHPLGVRSCPASERACGAIASIAWAPDGSEIAYVVRTKTREQVIHVILRNGTHDTVIDRNARPGQPAWRADSGALAYVGAGTRPVIYDVAHDSRRVIRWNIARSPSVHLAFAPRGDDLAIGTENAALLLGRHNEIIWRGQIRGIGWLGSRLAVSARFGVRQGYYVTHLYTVRRSRATLSRSVRLPSPILATHGRTIALVEHDSLLAGSLGSLRTVLKFRLKPCFGASGALVCEIPIGDQGVEIG
jgi:hypothetical protein